MPKLNRILPVFILLAACDGDPVRELPILPASISPERVYAGGAVTIRSARFAQMQNVDIWLDAIKLPTVAAGADSVVVRVPRTARGSFQLYLGRNGIELGQLEVAGYVGYRAVQRPLGAYLLVWPEGGNASVIGGISFADPAWQTGEVVRVVPRTGAVVTIVSGFDVGRDVPRLPGRTPDPGILLLQRTGGSLESWRLLPTPVLLDTLAQDNHRHFALFNDSTYFAGYHHRVESRRPDGRMIYTGVYEETHEVVISPSGDRATLRVNGSPTGPPVFNTASGDTAYHVRNLFRSYGVSFSQNGDTLWMLGVTQDTEHRSALVMLNARTGEVLDQMVFDSASVHSMRRDPAGGRLFILASEFGVWDIDLIVLDDRTLKVIGYVEGTRSGVCDGWCDYSVVAAGLDGVYVVSPRYIFEFDYLQ